LRHWRDVAAEQIIADLEAAGEGERPLALLLRRAFASRPALEKAVRSWASFDPAAREAVQAVDRGRLDYLEKVGGGDGRAAGVARARAQILYWTFLGFVLSDKPLSGELQQSVLDELMRLAER